MSVVEKRWSDGECSLGFNVCVKRPPGFLLRKHQAQPLDKQGMPGERECGDKEQDVAVLENLCEMIRN